MHSVRKERNSWILWSSVINDHKRSRLHSSIIGIGESQVLCASSDRARGNRGIRKMIYLPLRLILKALRDTFAPAVGKRATRRGSVFRIVEIRGKYIRPLEICDSCLVTRIV